jgi:hypothetical protein
MVVTLNYTCSIETWIFYVQQVEQTSLHENVSNERIKSLVYDIIAGNVEYKIFNYACSLLHVNIIEKLIAEKV